MPVRDSLKVALTRSPRLYTAARRTYSTGRFLTRGAHEADYRAFALFDGDGPFLDVGANAGMSALSFRVQRRRNAIVSIEPNPYHEPDLRWTGRLVGRFGYKLWAAGAEDGAMTLHIPVYRGVALTTEASLLQAEVVCSPSLRERLGERMDGPDFSVATRVVPVRRLDGLGLSPSFVKLDVQGTEHAALRGLRRTLERCRPVLMIEAVGPESWELLSALGYEPLAYDRARNEVVAPRGDEVNLFFRPR